MRLAHAALARIQPVVMCDFQPPKALGRRHATYRHMFMRTHAQQMQLFGAWLPARVLLAADAARQQQCKACLLSFSVLLPS